MASQKYSVNQHLVETVLSWVKSGEIAIPEIQRPFVWSATQVRDFLDSLYQGYPVGYIIAWKNPNIRLKDGSFSEGRKILIDGQQRVTALSAALVGKKVVTKDYQTKRIEIAFNPIEEKFEVSNVAIKKNRSWIPDVAPVMQGELSLLKLIREYQAENPQVDEQQLETAFTRLVNIPKKQIGMIELSHDLDIDEVTEIFIRINSKGVVLSQADFAMSKIAANEEYGGNELRKAVDYFCHMAVAPEFFAVVSDRDPEFAASERFRRMAWLKNENDDLYDPSYSDLLRVAFTSEFNRGRLAHLVSLLSGRNFETRTYEEAIAAESFSRLSAAVDRVINETDFKRFLMIVRSAGFIDPKLIRARNVLNFAYALYLKLRAKKYPPSEIERIVRRWLVLTMLTGRYSGSPETRFEQDIRGFDSESEPGAYLARQEAAQLSEAFWDVELPQLLTTSSIAHPSFNVFLAAQVKQGDRGFLSKDILVKDMIEHRGDIHHLYPYAYLKRAGLTKTQYNQVANFVYSQSEINIAIGDQKPATYMAKVGGQIETGKPLFGGIVEAKDLEKNLSENAVPLMIKEGELENYMDFLDERRLLMAKKMQGYYAAL